MEILWQDVRLGDLMRGIERAHPCMCGGQIEERDRENKASPASPDFWGRVRLHLASCPRRSALMVVGASMRELAP
jgi:hypothetical protein